MPTQSLRVSYGNLLQTAGSGHTYQRFPFDWFRCSRQTRDTQQIYSRSIPIFTEFSPMLSESTTQSVVSSLSIGLISSQHYMPVVTGELIRYKQCLPQATNIIMVPTRIRFLIKPSALCVSLLAKNWVRLQGGTAQMHRIGSLRRSRTFFSLSLSLCILYIYIFIFVSSGFTLFKVFQNVK